MHNIGIFGVRLGEFMLGICELPLVWVGLHSMGFWVSVQSDTWLSWMWIGWDIGEGVLRGCFSCECMQKTHPQLAFFHAAEKTK